MQLLQQLQLFVLHELARWWLAVHEMYRGRKVPSYLWSELPHDECHIVVATEPLGDVIVFDARLNSFYAVRDLPMHLRHIGDRF